MPLFGQMHRLASSNLVSVVAAAQPALERAGMPRLPPNQHIRVLPRRRCVMVPDPRLDPSQCSSADQVLRSLEDFDPQQWGLPPFP